MTASVNSIIDPDILNLYFQDTNLDQQYSMPELMPIPEGTRVATIDEETVLEFLLKQKRTASGPDFPLVLETLLVTLHLL